MGGAKREKLILTDQLENGSQSDNCHIIGHKCPSLFSTLKTKLTNSLEKKVKGAKSHQIEQQTFVNSPMEVKFFG